MTTNKTDKKEKEAKIDKRFKLLKKDTITCEGVKLYRLQATKDFKHNFRYHNSYSEERIIKKGELGGYVDKEDVLDHSDSSWIFGEASKIFNGSTVRDGSTVDGSTVVRSTVDGSTVRDGSTVVRSTVDGSTVRDGSTVVRSTVDGSTVRDGSTVVGSTLSANMKIAFGILTDIKDPFCKTDGSFIKYIACSVGIFPVNNKYLLYKKVDKVKDGLYISLHDSGFVYKDNQIAEVLDCDMDMTKSCASGLHVSHAFYWYKGDTLIACEVEMDDIITCLDGKLRVKKLKVLGEIGK